MRKDDRDTLEVFKAELDFIEKGGYGRSVQTPWKPTSIFRDSLSCLNFGDPNRTHPCNECLLMDFVPPDAHAESVPCHHIPLNERGVTVETIEQSATQQELEESLKIWLRKRINQLEEEWADQTAI
jgi:hypothetical protein